MINFYQSVKNVQSGLLKSGYLADRKTATTLFLAARLQKPLLVEGPAGVGKTYLARALAEATGSDLIRLQCYPGLDEGKALYEWNYQKQLLYLQTLKEGRWEEIKAGVYTAEFLLARPVLKSFLSPVPVVLLVDELDKSDDELESFLLEAFSEFQVSIPEMGTVRAKNRPRVIITSNSTRDFSDAMKRRCLFLYMPFPDQQREEAIIRMHIKEIDGLLAGQVAAFIAKARKMALRKQPGIAETLDWARSLMELNTVGLEPEAVLMTLNALVKYREDVAALEARLDDLLPPAGAASPERETPLLPEDGDHLSRFNF